jgi:class 3 adenylate cyclase/CheY-like chemotaxis protein
VARERILVVDDSAENRSFIVDFILKPNRFQGAEARDGIEAMEIIRREPPDLILLDLQMPRLDGLGVLEALRAENISNIPVILMTLHGSQDIAVRVFRMGVRDYIEKPYTQAEMLQAIESSLAESRLRKEKEALTARLLNANRELHSRNKDLTTLSDIGKDVAALLDPAQLLARIVEAAIALSGSEQGSIFLVEGGELMLRAVRRRADSQARPVAERSQDKQALSVIETGKAVNLAPQDLAPIRARNANAPQALLYMPLVLGQRNIGVLGVENFTAPRPFSETDLLRLATLSDYAAIAIENARNFRQLEDSKEAEKGVIRGAFERYVAPTVVNRVLSNPDALRLGGERREISIMFADIRGYTTMSENADPEALVEMLNNYFKLATEIVFAREGTLDKFLGDAVMAIFNAPVDQPDHAARALETALTLRDAVEAYNATLDGEGFRFGIGLTMGWAVVGNVGAAQAMNYTAIGDVINLAKRLQERAEPGQILVEESLIRRVGSNVQANKLGDLQLKGRRTTVPVYDLRGLK